MNPHYHTDPVYRKDVTVTINWEAEKYSLRIPISAKIGYVKFSIMEELGIPIAVDRQLLLCGGIELSDDESVLESGIKDGSELTLFRCILVTILAGGLVFEKIVTEDATVGDLKGWLVSDGVDIEDKVLQMGVDTKLDDRCHLWAAGINEKQELHLVTKS